MATSDTIDVGAQARLFRPGVARPASPPLRGYAVALGMVAAAGLIAFVVEHLAPQPNLSLVFVLPVIAAAAAYGWGPSLLSALAGVAVFDFFFIEPRMTFQVASPGDLWAMGLLLVVAAIVSTVAAESRRRLLAAERAAEQAEALHGLARATINAAPPAALLRAAAAALSRSFGSPAVVLEARSSGLAPLAAEMGAQPSPEDLDAAAWVAANDRPTRAGTYPFDQSDFDFWPAVTAGGRRLVLGVQFRARPAKPETQIELIAGYLAESSL
jgi:K+-sensing histidine kinase KdpD